MASKLSRKGALMISVTDSSWIKNIMGIVNIPGLPKTVLTTIEDKSGRTIQVGYVPRVIFEEWAVAPSAGKFYNDYVRGQGYEFHPDQREELLGKKIAQANASKQRTKEAELYRARKAREAEAKAKKDAQKAQA